MVAVITVEGSPQSGLVWWVPAATLVVLLIAAVVVLGRSAPSSAPAVQRPAQTLARLTGLPAWSAAGVALSLWSLTMAFVGFGWDVAWHVDLGRDQQLLTPPHAMILIGLGGMGLAPLAAIGLATAGRVRTGLRVGSLRIPWSAVPMGLLALGALAGFPLDNWWHATYGIDVTMWSPTHLLMIGGAAVTPVAAWLMLAEGADGRALTGLGRALSELLAAASLLGLSAFQLEFDLGIAQWQALYHPALVALAMGIALVAAREAGGRGAALRACVVFIVLRALLALLVGPLFGLSVERFPLYLGGALVVELLYASRVRLSVPLRAVATGLLVGTAGMAVEWAWQIAWGHQSWQPRLLLLWWVVVGCAVAGTLLGTTLGHAIRHASRARHHLLALIGFASLAPLLAVPFPRDGAAVTATLSATAAGPSVPVVTRDGRAAVEQDVRVRVAIAPADGVADADYFGITAWQGGSVVERGLRLQQDGTWLSDGTVPTGGAWKSVVRLTRGASVAAVAISLPPDTVYSLHPVEAPLTSARTAAFVPATTYLTREAHAGNPLPAILAYTALGAVAVLWALALLGVGEAMRRHLRARVPLPALHRTAQ